MEQDNCLLQILIPQYNETDEIIKPLLDSIEKQEGINVNDFSVIIANDGSGIHLSDELLRSYSYKIVYYLNEHAGVSATRNFCLDQATSKYVMFCDADDEFYGDNGLEEAFKAMDRDKDFISFSFLGEVKRDNGNGFYYEKHDHDGIFVHGKFIKRSYLLDNNIRFNECLDVCEDSGFISLCRALTNNYLDIEKTIYIWKYREGSVSRADPNFNYSCYPKMIKGSDSLIQEFLKRSLSDKAAFYSVLMMVYTYYVLNETDFSDDDHVEYRNKAIEGFKEYTNKYGHLWSDIADNDKKRMIKMVCEDAISERYYYKEIEFIEDWLSDIK